MSVLTFFRRAEPGALPSPDLDATEIGATPTTTVEAPLGRRERRPDPGAAVIMDAVGQKLINAWLQNRNQTLVPLTLNFRVLSAEQHDSVISFLAALLLAGRPAADAMAAVPSLKTWLTGLGADPADLATFDAALAAPKPLGMLMEAAHALDTTIYAFIASLAAADQRFPASNLLCDVIEARFELPSAAIRSATRRYRR